MANSDPEMNKGSVKSPSTGTDFSNLGNMPPTWDFKQQADENLPPTTPATSSVEGIGPKASQGT